MDILRVKINGEWTDIPAIVGPNGTTFIPSVDSQGNLSWSNTGGQPNPPTVNIKGPQGQAGRDGAPGQTGAAGTTFIPYVASNGDISWSNADGKPNPATINIRGPQGETGQQGPPGADGKDGQDGSQGSDGISPTVTVSEITDGHRLTITDADHPSGQTVDILNGQNGQEGTPGADGTTFTPSVAANGDLSWNNDGGKTNPATVNIKGPAGDSGEAVEETVTGSTPSITAAANHRYLCGEVSTILFTPSATGICEVIFTSGTTAAVLTLPNTVKLPAWFDATILDTNTIYEINVLDGVYLAVMMWPAT